VGGAVLPVTAPVRAEALYGAPLEGHAVVDVPIDLAARYARAHRRLRGGLVGVHVGDGALTTPEGRPLAPEAAADRWTPVPDGVAEALAGAQAPVVLAGPGVVEDGAVPGLHALAAGGSLGVLNTWGAKGVFDWRSRHHLATVGLQARDFELGGLADADLIVATGIDEDEARARWRLAPVVDVLPTALGPLSEVWGRAPRPIAVPPLREGLARVTQDGWAAPSPPLAPTRVTQHYGRLCGGGGLVLADPGVAGYWVARTVPTTGIGGVIVPASETSGGFALACATVAARLEPSRRVLVVLDRLDEDARRLLAEADRLGVRLAVEVWSPDGPVLDADAHLARLDQLLRTGGVVELATHAEQIHAMIDVAGPLVAWRTPT
jgi:hypothetical protein